MFKLIDCMMITNFLEQAALCLKRQSIEMGSFFYKMSPICFIRNFYCDTTCVMVFSFFA